ncbi:MAG: HEPN domain-containing protein [Acidobacteriota bacterium]|nr:HEPN domain-containing protein [Acidobacteriota bacterium]MDH3523323.1 HEPN domain-containing protein [Acidobacteriota bacterium]
MGRKPREHYRGAFYGFIARVVGFHARQAAEKLLEAWLTSLGTSYPPTHDLSLLLYKLEEAGAEVADLVTALLTRVEGLLADSTSAQGP